MLQHAGPTRSPVRRRAFTAVELILALALSTLVVAGVVSLFGMMWRADQRQAVRFQEATDLAIAQRVIRQAMMTLVARAPQAEDDPQRRNNRNEVTAIPDPPDDQQRRELTAVLMRDLEASDEFRTVPDLESELADALIGELMALEDPDLPQFELFYEDLGGFIVPRIELVLLTSPVPTIREGFEGYDPEYEELSDEEALLQDHLARLKEQSRGVVRGSLEIMFYEEGPALQWRPVDPPGRPFVLIRKLERIEWWLLPHYDDGDAWTDAPLRADYKENFPLAVRLLVWTTDDRHIDWIFETDTVAGR